MLLSLFRDLVAAISEVTLIEWVAFISLTAYVFLATRQVALAWPISMIGVSAYFILAYRAQLYAEMPLQVFYFSISMYGWYLWKYGGVKNTALPVTFLTNKMRWLLLGIGTAATIGVGYLLDHLRIVFNFFGWDPQHFIPTDVPYWDAGTTVFSIIGTWLQAQKKIENWIVWLAVDLVYVGLFYYKGYLLLCLLNVLYLGFATYGFKAWRNSMEKN
ncbi:MAG: nicotinamide riboside transporter PnuC [Bacteroidia bacterium]